MKNFLMMPLSFRVLVSGAGNGKAKTASYKDHFPSAKNMKINPRKKEEKKKKRVWRSIRTMFGRNTILCFYLLKYFREKCCFDS